MLRALALTLALAAAAAAAAGAAVPGGSIVGLFSNGATGGCDLWRLSPSTGDNATIATGLAMCDGVQQYFPSVATRTAGSGGALVVAIGTGSHVFSIDVTSGAQAPLAPMPALNDSNWPLGLVAAPGDKLYLVFQNDVMQVAGGKLTRLPIDIAVPQYSQVTSCPTCGTGGSPVIFVADEASTTIFCFDLGVSRTARGAHVVRACVRRTRCARMRTAHTLCAHANGAHATVRSACAALAWCRVHWRIP